MPLNVQAVKKIMIQKGITNKMLSERMNVTLGRVSNILNKETKSSRVETIGKIAKALEVEPLDIVKEE